MVLLLTLHQVLKWRDDLLRSLDEHRNGTLPLDQLLRKLILLVDSMGNAVASDFAATTSTHASTNWDESEVVSRNDSSTIHSTEASQNMCVL